MSEYDGRRDGFESYNVAIAAQRAKILMERCPAARRVEVIGQCELYLGDCMEIMPSLGGIAAVVTDPPYGINASRARNSEKWGWKDYGGGEWDKERPSPELIRRMVLLSKNVIIWGGNYFADLLQPSQKWLVWDKGQTDFSLADCELAWCSFDGAVRRITLSRSKALQDGKQHPTQKPVAVMMWCLDQLPRLGGGAVLDPFMGSGTTGVACAKAGKAFTGIEIDEGYFEIACERIRQAYRQPDMFVSAASARAAEQTGFTFDDGGEP